MGRKKASGPDLAGHGAGAQDGKGGAGKDRLEFHREACALVPDLGDPDPGIAFYVRGGGVFSQGHRFCTCSTARMETCRHIIELTRAYKRLKGHEDFRSSPWGRLAALMAEGCRETPASVRLRHPREGAPGVLKVLGSDGRELITYFSLGADRRRLVERLGKVDSPVHRGYVLDQLAELTLTAQEHHMREQGFKTRRMALEDSFWYRLFYHGFRELGDGYRFHPAVNERSGEFTVTLLRDDQTAFWRMPVAPLKVRPLLETFRDYLPNQHGLSIQPVPLKSIFKVTPTTELDLDVRPMIRVLQENGEAAFYEQEERFRYGDLVYVRELGILAELERPGGKERKFTAPSRMVLKASQVPNFIESLSDEAGDCLVDAELKPVRIFDRLTITVEALERDWCWLSAAYGEGNAAISLSEILNARQSGRRYIATEAGWIDCRCLEIEALGGALAGGDDRVSGPDGLKVSRLELLKLAALSPGPLGVAHGGRAELVKTLLELRPSRPLPEKTGLASALWPYQHLGVQWLWFLHENRFGGLLCDDMGLGKTHQVMALMAALRISGANGGPYLVVCPTTVLSHWEAKLKAHAPDLRAAVYHGLERELVSAASHDVILTSCGILRRDASALAGVKYGLAVFDEVQYLKNPQTAVYKASRALNADMKLGLTGTPIENTIEDLKALMDIVMPGYMGDDETFRRRYVEAGGAGLADTRREELGRLISPFTLRRLKKTVLTELPEKIEDERTCFLSEDQVGLYREAIASRGEALLQTLREGREPVPYLHIFALLNILKQICDHPALVQGVPREYERYDSGKWDLFKEILSEALESGQKVVVYSQYLDMIEIIKAHLEQSAIEHVTLTGRSTGRGRLIERFNTDPACRVFVGSLKAGGTGIDLVAASVVIHYDRWWNAARENQATDRIHRIGQTRGVQVFKLVTQGTLEEKIAAIIARKRGLMDDIVKEDDPGLLKTFSRQDLVDLLAPPGA